ncbi:lytic transglycosylase [Candidatus Synechococcus spongiarum]|uniref:lytic transglycosylase n=1 Tax=Candidatus Synechococcus spongiarum TaxID=431041 RepID=UPI0013775A74|nr:LysM peptidoglycan-binding domain-containing protein [Candidatus Synechococcus spongiarum]
MARSLRLLAAIPLLSLLAAPALASGRYRVQPRDSFHSVARKCQVDVYELIGLNPRPDNVLTLKLGEDLVLPANARCGGGAGSAGSAATASTTYQVQPRDSFYGVARKCRVEVHELMRLNPRPDNTLKLGEQLRLPGNAQCGNSRDLAGADVRQASYQVQPRDGFYSIARKCQVDAEELMRLNAASGTTLRPGQQLTLPANARCSAAATVARTGTTTTQDRTTAGAGVTISYEVQPREGFYSISQKCQVDTAELISLNPDVPTVLRAGLQLQLPGHARCPEESTAVASASPSQGAGGANSATGTKSYYEVQPRDGFYSIARKCRVNPQALMALNPRPGDTLHVGEQLELPGGAQCEQVVAVNPDAAEPNSRGGRTVGSGWRTYGSLQVDWQGWQMIEGHWVTNANSPNNSGQPLHLAVNCKHEYINQTSSDGQWSAWREPDSGFEEQLMNDLCQEKQNQG